MYNLTVATAHTYFVGEGAWLVHNTCQISISDDQFGEKVGQHMRWFGLDMKDPVHRLVFRNMITDIATNPAEIRIGDWRGGITNAYFFRQGKVVVVTDVVGKFITILHDGINNSFFRGASQIPIP